MASRSHRHQVQVRGLRGPRTAVYTHRLGENGQRHAHCICVCIMCVCRSPSHMRSGCKGCTQNSRRRCVGKWAGRGPPKSARAPQRLQGPGTAWAVPPSVGPHPGAAATGQGTAPRVSKARPRCLARRPRRSLQINAGRRPDLTEDGAQRWASAVPPARSAMRNSGRHGLGTRGAMDSELGEPWSRNSGSHGLGTRGAMDSELREPWTRNSGSHGVPGLQHRAAPSRPDRPDPRRAGPAALTASLPALPGVSPCQSLRRRGPPLHAAALKPGPATPRAVAPWRPRPSTCRGLGSRPATRMAVALPARPGRQWP